MKCIIINDEYTERNIIKKEKYTKEGLIFSLIQVY